MFDELNAQRQAYGMVIREFQPRTLRVHKVRANGTVTMTSTDDPSARGTSESMTLLTQAPTNTHNSPRA